MRGFESHPYIPNSVPDVQAEMLKEIGMSSLEAVSYTHLDVYKRQGYEDPEACGHMGTG